ILSFPVALHALSPGRSYFLLVAGSTATEGLPPSDARSFSSARAPPSRSPRSASRRPPFAGAIRFLSRDSGVARALGEDLGFSLFGSSALFLGRFAIRWIAALGDPSISQEK